MDDDLIDVVFVRDTAAVNAICTEVGEGSLLVVTVAAISKH